MRVIDVTHPRTQPGTFLRQPFLPQRLAWFWSGETEPRRVHTASSAEIYEGRAEFQWGLQVLFKHRPGSLKRREGRRTDIYGFLKGTVLTLQPFRLSEDGRCCRLSLKHHHLKGGRGQTAASAHWMKWGELLWCPSRCTKSSTSWIWSLTMDTMPH